MGNVQFKENGVPKIPIKKDKPLPKKIIASAEKILDTLWDDDDIAESKCANVQLFDNSEKKDMTTTFPYALIIEFDTIGPYLTKERRELFGGNGYIVWIKSSKHSSSGLPTEINKQWRYLKTILNNNDVILTDGITGNYRVVIEVLHLNRKEMDQHFLQQKVEKLETHISLMPGGEEYLKVQKHWDENTNK